MIEMGPSLEVSTAADGSNGAPSVPAGGRNPPTPATHSNLYIKNIPQEVDEQTLQAIFQPFGTIECCRVQRNPRNTTGLTFGFVKFRTVEQATSAIAGLNGATVANSVLEVRLADADPAEKAATGHMPSDNLYVRNLPASWREADLRALFAVHGTVLDCRVLPNQEHHRGQQALVRMASVEEASRAIASLNGTPPGGGATDILLVRFADTAEEKAKRKAKNENAQNNGIRFAPYQKGPQNGRQQGQAQSGGHPSMAGSPYPAVLPPTPHSVPQPQYCSYPAPAQDPSIAVQPQTYAAYQPPAYPTQDPNAAYYGAAYATPAAQTSSSVYVKNLPHDADKLYLYEKFAPHGAITSVKTLADETGRCKGVGFVNFADNHGAMVAIQALNGSQCGDKHLHVSLQTHRTPRAST